MVTSFATKHWRKRLRKACGDGGMSNKAESDLAGFLKTVGRKDEGRVYGREREGRGEGEVGVCLTKSSEEL